MKEETITATGEAMASIDAAVVLKIAEHYCHAKRKHPYFADRLCPDWLDPKQRTKIIGNTLAKCRKYIENDIARHRLMWDALANCEVWEIHEALARGDKAAAVEECYDAIAVLLRTVDVLEGRQKLGRPE